MKKQVLCVLFLTGSAVLQPKKVSTVSSQTLKQKTIEHCSCGGSYQLLDNTVNKVKIENEQICTSHPWGTDLVLRVTTMSLYGCDMCGKVYEKAVTKEEVECHGFDDANGSK